ncbi:MAG: secretin N-terminal domain-containing protein [Phycisphaerales bacterium]
MDTRYETMERHAPQKEQCQSLFAAVLGVLLLFGGPLFALEGNPPGALCHKIVPVNNITPERGRNFLTQLQIGTTVSRLAGTNALVVTGDEVAVQKALAVLDLVDTRIEFDVREVGPAWPGMASNAQIADAVGGICIGSFANPPRDKNKMRAIIDVHDGNVVIVAPAIQLQDIRVALELGPAVARERRATANPANAVGTFPIPATAMLESSLNGSPRKPVISKEIQAQLDEMRRQADAIEALRRANEQPGENPTSTPMSDNSTPGGDMPEELFDPNGTDPNLPAALQQVGAAPDANAPSEDFIEPPAAVLEAEPAAAEPTAESADIEPQQTVSPDSDRITEPKIEPKLMSDTAATGAPTPMKPSALSPASPYEPAEFPNGEEIINLNLPEKLAVIDLLDLAGKHLNLSYLYDPAKVSGEVTLKLNGTLKGQMKKKDLYLLLEATLQEKDLVMTRHKGNIIRVMLKSEAVKLDPELVTAAGTSVQAGNAVIQQVFDLKHIDCASAENLIKGMDLAINTTPVTESKKLIITAYAHRMARIEQLLQLVDQPGVPRKYRDRQLRYTMAKPLVEKVKALAEQLENVTVTVGSPETAQAVPTQMAGESDVAYRTRLAQLRQAQTAARAAAAARGQAATQETKPGVYLDADERTNRVLMIGEEEQLATVEELVAALDIAQQDLQALQLYRIKHVDAEEVARKLQELGIIRKMPETSSSQRSSQTSSRITSPTTAAARAAQQAAATADAAATAGTELTEEGLVSEPQVVVVESNNSLLVNGTPEQHAKISSIIEYVDSEMDLEEIPYKIYPLENSSPEHLATILTSLLEESEQQTQDKDGKIETVVTKRQEQVAIVPDPNTYSLIVYASKKNQEWIQSLVKQLDKRRPQVLIDVTLVEVSKTEAFTYDLNLIESIPNLTSTSGVIDAITTPADLVTAGRSQFADMQADSGAFTGYYGDKHINALLTAMQSKKYGRVLAKPKILVNDNETGDISTTETTYVKKTSSIPYTTGTAGTQSDIVTTSVDYQNYDAGIELSITPHISEGDLLRLDITLGRSDFRDAQEAGAPPDTIGSDLKTAVTVPDGSTIILGGMVKLNQSKGGSKVPILGDLPLVGGLFRNINNSDIESKLYVFVKAEVIRPEEGIAQGMKDLVEISDRNRMAFEKHESEFQGYQDWPGIKPKPVDPPKVLDAQ